MHNTSASEARIIPMSEGDIRQWGQATEAARRMCVPGWAGSLGPFPWQSRPRVYERIQRKRCLSLAAFGSEWATQPEKTQWVHVHFVNSLSNSPESGVLGNWFWWRKSASMSCDKTTKLEKVVDSSVTHPSLSGILPWSALILLTGE